MNKDTKYILMGIGAVVLVAIILFFVLRQPTPNPPPNPPPHPPNPPHPPSVPLTPLALPISLLNKWQTIASQGGHFSFQTPNLVRYGSNAGNAPHWAYKTLTSGSCDVATFGVDPNIDTLKHCENMKPIVLYPLLGLRVSDNNMPNGQYFNFVGKFGNIKAGEIIVIKLSGMDASIPAPLRALLLQYVNNKAFTVQFVQPSGDLSVVNLNGTAFRPFVGSYNGVKGLVIG